MILKRGRVPATPHTEFYALKGVLSLEEIHGTFGFSGPYSRKMHLRSYPTDQAAPPRPVDFNLTPRPAKETALQPYHLRTGALPFGEDALRARKPLLFGPTMTVSISKPKRSMAEGVFFRNGERHELYFVQEGSGTLASEYGELPFRPGLYLVVPKGATYRIELSSKSAVFLIIDSLYPIHFPPHYLNSQGQAALMAPIVETEIEAPVLRSPRDEAGRFAVDTLHGGGRVTRLTLGHHPFDLAGWEGSLYPFAFDIKNHHGIAREIHTAPPLHQTFQSGQAPHNGFAICSFVPQMEGWHPKEVPAPYAHQNVDCDEVMFFSNASYTARKGVIEPGSMTFHPGSLPHSPQGAAALRSLAERGKLNTRRAVMLDTFFESLSLTETAFRCRDKEYALSWHAPARNAGGTLHGT